VVFPRPRDGQRVTVREFELVAADRRVVLVQGDAAMDATDL
jgi:hypothetical protein